MTLRTGRSALLCAVAVTMVVAGCGGEDGDEGQRSSEETTTQTSDAVITAPPTKSPEEKAEAEIIKTFEGLIADRDEFYTNASDYGNDGDVTWNAELVSTWNAVGQAETELTNWVGSWRKSEFEQVGEIVIATHNISDVTPNERAKSTACLDMTKLSYLTYDGNSADLPASPSQYQTWEMTWRYSSDSGNGGSDGSGWRVFSIDLDVDKPC